MPHILTHMKRCPGCNQGVESASGSETWHDKCYRLHRGKVDGCTAHDYCKRAKKEGW